MRYVSIRVKKLRNLHSASDVIRLRNVLERAEYALRLASLRKSSGKSHDQIARELSTDGAKANRQMIIAWESGRGPRRPWAERLARYWGDNELSEPPGPGPTPDRAGLRDLRTILASAVAMLDALLGEDDEVRPRR